MVVRFPPLPAEDLNAASELKSCYRRRSLNNTLSIKIHGGIHLASKSKTAPSASSPTRHVSLAGSHLPFQRVEKSLDAAGNAVPAPKAAAAAPKAGAPAAPAAPAADDPTGIKGYIAFSVAHALYPRGDGIDPDFPIANDIKLNGPSIAAEINVDAQHSATMHHLTWKSVIADDLSGLATVSNLVTLVQNNLSTPAGS